MIYYLYGKNSKKFISQFKNTDREITFIEFGLDSVFPSIDIENTSHILVSGDIDEIKLIFGLAIRHNKTIGIVPLPTQVRLAKIFDLPSSPMEAFDIAITPNKDSIDLLYCNDILAIDDIRIGNTTAIKEFEFYYPKQSFWKRIKLFLKAIVKKNALKHHKFDIKTAKDEKYTISALGMISLGYNNFSPIARVLKDTLSATDGQNSLLILSPISLFQYFISNPLLLFLYRWKSRKLPSFWGYIKSSKIEILADSPLKVTIDDSHTIATPITIETHPNALNLSVGTNFWQQQTISKNDRDTIKIDKIPKDRDIIEYFSKGLPLFSHASTQQYATLFTNLRSEGSISSIFIILLSLATMIATFGLFIDSSSVIIGAMLLAPLMQPIVSLSMGVLRQDEKLYTNSILTLMVGILTTLSISMVIAYIIPIQELSSQMASRLSPTLLDMFVAIASGIAAAYAKNDEKISSSLAGVAIAVALVPPLAVSGIGLGWGDISMFLHSLLLFMTNLIGIVLASAMTFLMLGYAPIKVAKKGILIWSIIAILITIPLYHSFETMRERSYIQKTLSSLRFEIGDKRIYLGQIEYIDRGQKAEIRCEVIVNEKPNREELRYLHEMIGKVAKKPVDIVATFKYRL
jgi:uncharacterized hydrophobic protein (TIGR00271 family)